MDNFSCLVRLLKVEVSEANVDLSYVEIGCIGLLKILTIATIFVVAVKK